jgi:hypothetical protein
MKVTNAMMAVGCSSLSKRRLIAKVDLWYGGVTEHTSINLCSLTAKYKYLRRSARLLSSLTQLARCIMPTTVCHHAAQLKNMHRVAVAMKPWLPVSK